MGTRHLTCVLLDDEIRVAQYGAYDGYFEGVGMDIVNFISKYLSNSNDILLFKCKINQCKFYTNEEINIIHKSIIGNEVEYNDEQAKILKTKYPELNRETGSDILDLIMEKNLIKLQNEFEFGYDGLYCEYAYVINLDTNELEIYTCSYNHKPLNKDERWYKDLSIYANTKDHALFYGVKFYAIFQFEELTNNTMQLLTIRFNSENEKEYQEELQKELLKFKKRKLK